MNFEKILTSAGKFRIELGLMRISRVLEILGNPEKGLNIIHVAGTNGKGSVCAILEEIFFKAGMNVGKFTSPHLFSYTERIVRNKRSISDLEFDNLIGEISKIDGEYKIGLTEFEILTAAGFLYFSKNSCDVVILEVGLGGRLDSTNVIENPLVSIITSISLEHTERLGDTIEKIAFEKAGIIKKGSPVVFLETNRGFETIKNEAERLKGLIHTAKPLSVVDNYVILNSKKLPFALNGRFQGENLALALKAVEVLNDGGRLPVTITDTVIEAALKDVRWKFRLEEIEINGGKVLIDACHNPDGARVLAEYLNEKYKGKRVKFIFGCLQNKDYISVLENFTSKKLSLSSFELLFYEFNYPNSLAYKDFILNAPLEFKQAKEIKDPMAEIAKNNADLTVVAGSIYMLGEVFKGI